MQGESNTGMDLSAKLDEAERRIAEHPAAVEHAQCGLIEWSVTAVFLPNLRELLGLLDAAATNQDLAFELIQNVRPPIVRDQFQRVVTQRLHNYLASTVSLVDHVRRVMKDRDDDIANEFELRKAALLVEQPAIPFVHDLRHFTLHRALPFIGHRLTETEGHLDSEVQLGVASLQTWDRWSSASRTFLRTSGDSIPLRHVIRHQGQSVADLNMWLLNALNEANAPRLAEVNRLVVARNAILHGVDQEAAERITAETSARRSLKPAFEAPPKPE